MDKVVLRLVLVCGAVLPLPAQELDHASHGDHASPAVLVEKVREATQQFFNVNNARQAGYSPAFDCVSGPDHGAMGIHYVNGGLVGARLTWSIRKR